MRKIFCESAIQSVDKVNFSRIQCFVSRGSAHKIEFAKQVQRLLGKMKFFDSFINTNFIRICYNKGNETARRKDHASFGDRG